MLADQQFYGGMLFHSRVRKEHNLSKFVNSLLLISRVHNPKLLNLADIEKCEPNKPAPGLKFHLIMQSRHPERWHQTIYNSEVFDSRSVDRGLWTCLLRLFDMDFKLIAAWISFIFNFARWHRIWLFYIVIYDTKWNR